MGFQTKQLSVGQREELAWPTSKSAFWKLFTVTWNSQFFKVLLKMFMEIQIAWNLRRKLFCPHMKIQIVQIPIGLIEFCQATIHMTNWNVRGICVANFFTLTWNSQLFKVLLKMLMVIQIAWNLRSKHFLPLRKNPNCPNSYWIEGILSINDTHDQLEHELNLHGELFHRNMKLPILQGPIENVHGNSNCMKYA